MSIHGFVDQNGQIQKYDYDDLENKPTIPAEVIIDDTLTEEGQAADAKAVGDAIANITIPIDSALSDSSTNPVQNKVITEALENNGLSYSLKQAFLTIFQHVAYTDGNGQTYYAELEEALAGGQSYTITTTLVGCESSNTATSIVEGRTYTTTITASYGYTLDGATVTATMGGETLTGYYNNGTISIPNVTGDLVISVTAVSGVSSISATYSAGTDTPIDISSASIINAYFNTDNTWNSASDSACICIPVTPGKQYQLSWSETDAEVVGTIFRWGFSDITTPTGQTLRRVGKTTPQDTSSIITSIANKSNIIIQLSSAYASNIISNGYLSVVELADRIYTNDSLDVLRQNLTVIATYVDTTTEEVFDYDLSGTFTAGNSTIIVSYGGKTANVTVNCAINGYLYSFNQSILSSGTKDFGFSGVEIYEEGLFNRYCYSHCPGSSSTDPLGLKALDVIEFPDLGLDFTLSFWLQQDDYSTALQFNPIFATIYTGSGTPSGYYISAVTKESDWSVSISDRSGKGLSGFGIQGYQDKFILRITAGGNGASSQLACTAPAAFDPQEWHHYAITRKDNTIRMFVDGVLLTNATAAYTTVYQARQVAIASYFIQTSADKSNLQAQGFGQRIQDLYISDFCKWESSFNPLTISY